MDKPPPHYVLHCRRSSAPVSSLTFATLDLGLTRRSHGLSPRLFDVRRGRASVRIARRGGTAESAAHRRSVIPKCARVLVAGRYLHVTHEPGCRLQQRRHDECDSQRVAIHTVPIRCTSAWTRPSGFAVALRKAIERAEAEIARRALVDSTLKKSGRPRALCRSGRQAGEEVELRISRCRRETVPRAVTVCSKTPH
jgi:hypothetical protein